MLKLIITIEHSSEEDEEDDEEKESKPSKTVTPVPTIKPIPEAPKVIQPVTDVAPTPTKGDTGIIVPLDDAGIMVKSHLIDI
jgi:hypothetical protein